MSPRGGRALGAALAVAVALGLAEAGLRAAYPVLPSLAAAYGPEGRFSAPTGAPEGHGESLALTPARRYRTPGVGEPVGEPVTVVFAGDSTTATLDLPPDTTWWALAAAAVAGERPLTVVNAGSPGADAEDLAAEVAQARADHPTLVVYSLFADDLEDYQAFSIDQRWVLLPSAAPAALRPLVSHSYAANLAWFATTGARDARRARRLDEGGLARFDAALAAAREEARALGAAVAFVLMPAPNLAECPIAATPDHPCASYPRDLATMAEHLTEAREPVVDLRPLFARTHFPLTEKDEAGLAAGTLRAGVHVGAGGQRAIGEEVARQLAAAGLATGSLPATPPPLTLEGSTPPPPEAAPAASDTLRVAAPGAARALLGSLGETLAAEGITMAVTPAQGGDALRAVQSGTADVALLARPLRSKETGLAATPFGYIGAALLVAEANPIPSVAHDRLAALVAGAPTDWASLGGAPGPVDFVGRSSGPVMKLLAEGLALTGTPTPPATVDALADLSVRPLVLVPASFAEARTPPKGLRVLAVDGALPEAADVRAGRYPLARTMSVVTRADPPRPAASFVECLLGPDGQRAVDTSFIALK